jgi:hypothetical protein
MNRNPSWRIVAVAGLATMFLSAGCSSKDTTRPVKITALDKALLLDIAQKAISARLPSIKVEDLEPRCFMYTCYRDRMFSRTNELFEVRFRVKGTRQVEKDDGTAFEADEISVAIEPDGRIGPEGVRKVVVTYGTPDLSLLSREGSSGTPVRGEPFYPVKLNAAPAKPDRQQVEGIAVQAISKFRPAMDARGLQLDQLSFFDLTSSEDSLAESCYLVTYWNTNSLKVTAAASKIILDGEQVTVRIAANGQVRREGVSTQPLRFACNRAMLEEWRRNAAAIPPSPDPDKPDSPASPAP